ncbi:MAG: hypothetical protein KA534_07825 [Sediminibacterium sp.]|nr:hypothetical protein [Sediminibacterium sp.]MBP6145066.1 hypothetical protein [Sediminibacterium sp.]
MKQLIRYFFFCLLMVLGIEHLNAQDIDLFAEKDTVKVKDITTATFKSSRVVNGQSIENVGVGVLDFKILHRFGAINQGGYELFGIDQATMRMGLDYGLTNRFMFGIGRSTYQKQYDGFVKYKLLQQQSGLKEMPVGVSLVSTIIYKSLRSAPNAQYLEYSTDKLSYAHQLLIARKFNDYFSLQITPTLVHYNLVETSSLPNDFKSIGISMRQRISKRVNITGEYFYRIDKLAGYHDPLTFGLDIETGGHVFQLHVTNATGMTERTFINETTGSWSEKDIRFGFNLVRAFTLKKPKALKNID